MPSRAYEDSSDRRVDTRSPRNDRYNGSHHRHHDRSRSRDRYQPASRSPRRYTPPHDRYTPPRSMAPRSRVYRDDKEDDGYQIKGSARRYDDRRDRSPSPGINYDDQPTRIRGRPRPVSSAEYKKSSESPSPPRDRSPFYGGPPSREVILEGLPLDLTEEDISKQLKQSYQTEGLEDVRVIRERQTKVSRGFGFLRFPSLEKSKAFLDRNYPIIYLYSNDSADGDNSAAKVRLAYSRERDDRGRSDKSEGEWTCKICTFVNFPGRVRCHKCQTPQIDMATFGNAPVAKPPEFVNSGDSDVSPDGLPSQFLLLRGLEPTVSEDLLAKGVAKLYKPSGHASTSNASATKKGNAKVASTTGDANLGAKDGSLRRVLLVRDRQTNESWRYGFAEFGMVDDAQAAMARFNSFDRFTISSKPVVASYVHAGVFVPVVNANEAQKGFTFSPLGNTAAKLAYWDKDAYIKELVVSVEVDEKTVSSKEARARTANDKAAAAAEKEGLVALGKEAEAKARKRKAEANVALKTKKTAPAHLQFWSDRHAELHGVKVAGGENDEGGTSEDVETQTETNKNSIAPPSQSFSDPNKNCCYLCSRQFKSEAEVNKHERLSQLHRDNMANEDLRKKAMAKMVKAGILINPEEDTPEYRDRARERRAAFGAGKKISLPMKKTAQSAGSPDKNPITNDNDVAPIVPSKGASLLAKMGHKAGEGLGASGTGMTAPIATDMYVAGVGLGAQGGKMGSAVEEAERNTRGDYKDFAEKTRDKAKERFDRM